MPTLTIDNRSVTVPDGSSVLQAAEALGIVVPHLCWHEKLGAVGACRLCAVQVQGEKVKGIQMSCLITAEEGMVVNTLHPEAVETRRHVIEWLMASHPHDCPVCDEGGECQLQEMTIAAGHSVRRFRGRKATSAVQELGPFIVQEMNRCIRCYRCVRAYRDYFGGRDFGVFGSRQRVVFGRIKPGRLESPFAGNLAEVCPTGVFTDRTWRFNSRNWDLQQAISVCPHCGVGCATIPGARYRELQRIRAGHNPALNDGFICDRGRFGKGFENRPDRPRTAHADNQPLSTAEASKALRQRLDALRSTYGPASIAWLASPRAGLETLALLRQAASCGERVIYNPHERRDHAARAAARIPAKMRCTLADVRTSDVIVVVGCSPLQEAPLLAAAIRQAQRAGAEVAVLDPRPSALPCPTHHISLPPQRLQSAIESLAGEGSVEPDIHAEVRLTRLRLRLIEAKRPVLIGGADLLGASGVDTLHQAGTSLSRHNRPCGVYTALPGANSFAGGLFAESGDDFDQLRQRIELGEVRALICIESDPLTESCDPQHTAAALQHLKLLAAADYLPTAITAGADLFIPTTAATETEMLLVNSAGQAQALQPVMQPGEPLRITGAGDHPPRTFVDTAPGAEPLPAAELLAGLFDWPVELQALRARLAADEPLLAGIDTLVPGDGGHALPASPEVFPAPVDTPVEGLQLLTAPELFVGTPLTAFSPPLAALPGLDPLVTLSPETALMLGLAAGDRAQLIADATVLAVTVAVDTGVAAQVVVFSGSDDVPWTAGDAPRPCSLTKEVSR